jgi:hypothetical protein
MKADPLLGRFMAADSIVPGWGDPQSLNRYSYVLGNPLRYTDPTGHEYRPQPTCNQLPIGCTPTGPSAGDIYCATDPEACFCAAFPWLCSSSAPSDPSAHGTPQSVCNHRCQVEAALQQNPGLVCLSPAVAHLCAVRVARLPGGWGLSAAAWYQPNSTERPRFVLRELFLLEGHVGLPSFIRGCG